MSNAFRPMRMSLAGLLGSTVLVAGSPVAAATLCVNPGGSGGCFTSIAAAIDATPAAGTLIDVAAGTYTESSVVIAKRVTIRGAGAGVTTWSGTSDPLLEVHAAVTVRDIRLEGQVAVYDPDDKRTPTATLTDVVIAAAPFSSGSGLVVGGPVKLVRATVTGFAGVGVESIDRLSVSDSTITGNGYGVSNYGGRVKLVNSTVSGNDGPACAGISNEYTYRPDRHSVLRLEHSTIADNHASTYGGGICNSDVMELRDTIVAGNTAGSFDANCHAGPGPLPYPTPPIRALRKNLVEDTGSCTFSLPGGSTVLVGDALLDTLQDNGGPTLTQAPLAGSPVLGALTTRESCRMPDQRGVPRPVPCDLGAYEQQ